jgi:hypothetical protein
MPRVEQLQPNDKLKLERWQRSGLAGDLSELNKLLSLTRASSGFSTSSKTIGKTSGTATN